MNSVKIIHTADLHLGSGRTGVKTGKTEIENTFFRIIDLCNEQQVDFLLICGDLFDSSFVSSELVQKVSSAFAKIPGTIVAISPGNHDCACAGSVYIKHKFPDNVVIFSSFLEYKDYTEKGVRLWGAGFTERFEKLPLLQYREESKTDLINLCVLHGELVSDNLVSEYNPISLAAIEGSGFEYIGLGHIHKRSEIKKLSKTYYAYSGCPDGRGFDESGGCGVYIGSVSKNECRLDYLELSSRKYIFDVYDISGLTNTFEIADAVLKDIQKKYGENYMVNLYRITLSGEVSADTFIDIGQLTSVLGEKLEYIEIIDKTDTCFSEIKNLANENSLRGIFVRKMVESIEKSDDNEKVMYKEALKIGLKSFDRGVTLYDN